MEILKESKYIDAHLRIYRLSPVAGKTSRRVGSRYSLISLRELQFIRSHTPLSRAGYLSQFYSCFVYIYIRLCELFWLFEILDSKMFVQFCSVILSKWFLWPVAILVLVYRWGISTHGFFDGKGVSFRKPLPLLGNLSAVLFRTRTFQEVLLDIYGQFGDKR